MNAQTSSAHTGSTHPSCQRRSAATTIRNRCQHRTATGRQCRIPASGSRSAFCRRHSQSQSQIHHRDQDFSALLLSQSGALNTADDINAALAAIFQLLAQGRVSPRRASSLAYLISLVMQNASSAETHDDESFGGVFDAIRAANQRSARELAATSEPAAHPAPADAPLSAPSAPSVPLSASTPARASASSPTPPTSAPPASASPALLPTSAGSPGSTSASGAHPARASVAPASFHAASQPPLTDACAATASGLSAANPATPAPAASPTPESTPLLPTCGLSYATPFGTQRLEHATVHPAILTFEERDRQHAAAHCSAAPPPPSPEPPVASHHSPITKLAPLPSFA